MPLFPLNTVLLPGGPLPLRVFEARYVDMVSRCMKDATSFGVLLLIDGPEVGGKALATTASVGTLANIVDWYQGNDGLLGITAMGAERFKLRSTSCQKDGLNIGEVELLEPEARVPVPEEFAAWPEMLRAVLDDLGKLYETAERHYDDASWVGYRFTELLPVAMDQKQRLLEMSDPLERLRQLQPLLRQVRDTK